MGGNVVKLMSVLEGDELNPNRFILIMQTGQRNQFIPIKVLRDMVGREGVIEGCVEIHVQGR